ncbi:MAG: 2-succinyl-6-hydroxy-2,4-cyclohexadiene-1-carboxylate synthase [Myxococcota bacterium]|jgi:2-succinyl-6-hydroxy-2,4-cyclohexadiene-1-carboxylate synthase
MLHGFTGHPLSWMPVAEVAPPSWGPIVALALAGHDPQAPPVASFEATVDAIASTLAEASITAFDLVGYSLGARLGLGLMARHPERVRAATLLGLHPGLSTLPDVAARRNADARWVALLREHGIAAFVEAWEQLPLWASQHALASDVVANQRTTRLEHDPAMLARSLETCGLAEMPDYRDVLLARTQPTSLVVGARDEKFGRIARGLADAGPRLTLRSVAGVGHNVPLERPQAVWG